MKMTYEKVETLNGQFCVVATRADSNEMLVIPIDESNSDYQAYLRWLENPDAEEQSPLLGGN